MGHRLHRYGRWFCGGQRFAAERSDDRLPYRVKTSVSADQKLGDSDLQLQYNKVENLRIALRRIDGLLIRPGETFSFCQRVGLPTRRKATCRGWSCRWGGAGRASAVGGSVRSRTCCTGWFAQPAYRR